MNIFYYTNKGPTREENQDGLFLRGYSFTHTSHPETMRISFNRGLFAVLDGMGGENGGATATALILKTFETLNLPDSLDCHTIQSLLAIAGQVLKSAAAADAALANMGAACAGLWLEDDFAWVFNCGDCRVYKDHGGKLRKLSHDHTEGQRLFDVGLIDMEGMRRHPNKNRLHSAITAAPLPLDVFCQKIKVYDHEIFLICSDGLWEILPHFALERIMANPPEEASSMLAELAFTAPACDNVSFIILEI